MWTVKPEQPLCKVVKGPTGSYSNGMCPKKTAEYVALEDFFQLKVAKKTGCEENRERCQEGGVDSEVLFYGLYSGFDMWSICHGKFTTIGEIVRPT